jgi:SulP family sulfate permease
MRPLPVLAWLRGYERGWLRADLLAGVIVWSVVVPQAVAYAQIAGLPPEAGLMAAPGALLGYALLGTSRVLVVSATTATSAISAAAVAPLAHGDAARYAALSAALALVVAVVLAIAGTLKLGAITDLVSEPVMIGFLFGLGLTVAIGQLPDALGLPGAEGSFVDRVGALLRHVDGIDATTAAVAAASLALLTTMRRLTPGLPAPLVLVAVAICASAAFDLHGHGVETVGGLPTALPDPAVPAVSASDLANLVLPAFGVLILTAEAIGVSRALGTERGEEVDSNRDLLALGTSNVLAGFSSGFVQSGGASQTAAAESAAGRTPLTSVVCAALVLLTGAFLGGLFTDLPQATLAAIVIAAVAGFWRMDEMRRMLRLRSSAFVFALIALVGVLTLGVLEGLVVAAGLTMVYLLRVLLRPSAAILARDPQTGAWGERDRHPDWVTQEGVLVVRSRGILVYANVQSFKERVLAQATSGSDAQARLVVVDLSANDELDVQTADTLGELATAAERRGISICLVGVRRPAAGLLDRAGVMENVATAPTIDAALAQDSAAT